MKIDSLRNSIDNIDGRIIELLEERMEKAIMIRRHKKETLDKQREEEVLEKIKSRGMVLSQPAFLESLYKAIMQRSRQVQEEARALAGFQGIHGAYGEAACHAWNQEVLSLPFRDFSQVFDAVVSGDIDYGVVPVENTLGGIVGQVNSILIASELKVVGAVDMPIDHCLMAPPGTDHRNIRVVYSHPQALLQCRAFLARNRLEGREYYDTAGAALMLALDAPPGAAAIASRESAKRYGLEIIKENVQDSPNNRTRFFILAKEDRTQEEGNKCSAVFFTNDKAGALFSILQIFAKAEINLTRIESVPDQPGDYAIFIDFEGSLGDERVAAAVAEAKAEARNFRLLGCYRETRAQ